MRLKQELPSEGFYFAGTVDELLAWCEDELDQHGPAGLSLGAMVRAFTVKDYPLKLTSTGVERNYRRMPEPRRFSGRGKTRAARMWNAWCKARHSIPPRLRPCGPPEQYVWFMDADWRKLRGKKAVELDYHRVCRPAPTVAPLVLTLWEPPPARLRRFHRFHPPIDRYTLRLPFAPRTARLSDAA